MEDLAVAAVVAKVVELGVVEVPELRTIALHENASVEDDVPVVLDDVEDDEVEQEQTLP